MAGAGAFVPAMAAVLVLGFLAGAATGILAPRAQLALFALVGLVFGLMLGLPLGAAVSRRPDGLSLSDTVQVFLRLLTAFGAAGALAAGAWRIFRLKEGLDLRSEWGTLGQGMGGWRITPAAGLLLAGMILAALALMVPLPAGAPAEQHASAETST